MKRKHVIALMACAGLVILLIAAFYDGLSVRRYTAESDKLERSESIRAVLIADLHSHVYGENQKDLLALIKRQRPDVILLAGDIADDEAPFEGAEAFFKGAVKLAPVYYVSGNHELWANSAWSIKEFIRSCGATVLESSYEKLKIKGIPVIIAGVDDPDIEMSRPGFDWGDSMYRAFTRLKDEQCYKILIAHRPELIDVYRQFNFDLVVSGHAHGGQFRIPFLINGLFAPGEGWFPKYAGGLYRHGSLTHIVSRGLSFSTRLPRIFNPPEVAVIEIKGV